MVLGIKTEIFHDVVVFDMGKSTIGKILKYMKMKMGLVQSCY